MKKSILLSGFVGLFILGSCTKAGFNINRRSNSGQGDQNQTQSPGQQATEEEKAFMAESTLVWKRYRALENGIAAALDLPKEQVCMEVGQYSCVDKVHLSVLGGNDPYDQGQYERPEAPSIITALAVDRIILTSCNSKIQQEKASTPVVFKFIPLTSPNVNAVQLESQAVELYRRFLARDPSDQEKAAIAKFAQDAGSAEEAALALCYAIGTQAENIFL